MVRGGEVSLLDHITWDSFMEYGPKCLHFGLIMLTIYSAWNHNIKRTLISGAGCVITFILGW